MKYCGCKPCRDNGERNLQEEFEIYYSTRQLETDAVFDDIFKNSYTVGEISTLYDELEPKFNNSVAKRINEHVPFDAQAYWKGMVND